MCSFKAWMLVVGVRVLPGNSYCPTFHMPGTNVPNRGMRLKCLVHSNIDSVPCTRFHSAYPAFLVTTGCYLYKTDKYNRCFW